MALHSCWYQPQLSSPAASPWCIPRLLPPPSSLRAPPVLPKWPKSVSGVGLELGRTGRRLTGIPRWALNSCLGQALPEKLHKPGLALEDQHQTLQGWEGVPRFPAPPWGQCQVFPFLCARRCPALIPSLSFWWINPLVPLVKNGGTFQVPKLAS